MTQIVQHLHEQTALVGIEAVVAAQIEDDLPQCRVEFDGRHNRCQVETLQPELQTAFRLVGNEPRLRFPVAGKMQFTHVRPECRGAYGVGDQMDTVDRRGIDDPVRSPVVKDPGFAGRHVHRAIAADETHRRIGNDRNMNANPVAPVVVHIVMQGYLGPRSEPHQPGASEYRIK
jgi:hypothetical protein